MHPRLRPADLLLLAGHLEEPAGFIAGEKAFRMPFLGNWLRLMGVICDGDSRDAVLQEAEVRLQKGQSLILSEDGKINPEELAFVSISRLCLSALREQTGCCGADY